MAILEKHKVLEKNATLLLVFSFLVVTIGGISLDNIRSLYDEGFRSFAMISAIVGKKDMNQAVADIRRILQ